jgi:glutamate/tyrosine decarboxylase-like PLP-dependent enzyme
MIGETTKSISRIFGLDAITRNELWQHVIEAIEEYAAKVARRPVAPSLDPQKIRDQLSMVDFDKPQEPHGILEFVTNGLWDNQVHTPHPRYFGLFNPAPSAMGIVADALVAAFNPQLAAWSHSPFAVEIERLVLSALGRRFGYDEATGLSGTFTGGGAEANHTAIIAALEYAFPVLYRSGGLRSLPAQPVLYISLEAHHSLVKAACACGLGDRAVRRVPVDGDLRLDTRALERMIADDRAAGNLPFMVAATAGTTNCGALDPLADLAELAGREKLWLHVDAAWGGAAVLLPELAGLLQGIHQADSITFDAHKWLSVPMGAGMFLTRHDDILGRAFGIRTDYMPAEARKLRVEDPYAGSLQWSRRFTGLKVFLTLAVAGWEGCSAVLRQQTAMGELLRHRLREAGWEVVNPTPLPIVCFVDRQNREGDTARFIEDVAAQVISSGEAWISATRLAGRRPALRACITNYRTAEVDVAALVTTLDRARRAVLASLRDPDRR